MMNPSIKGISPSKHTIKLLDSTMLYATMFGTSFSLSIQVNQLEDLIKESTADILLHLLGFLEGKGGIPWGDRCMHVYR